MDQAISWSTVPQGGTEAASELSRGMTLFYSTSEYVDDFVLRIRFDEFRRSTARNAASIQS